MADWDFPDDNEGARESWRDEARGMVDRQLRARDVTDERVLRVMTEIPRHRFVPASYRDEAYADCPLNIGHRQTISQPYIVGIMSQLLAPRPDDRVLEIGAGSGYQAAVLAALVVEVHTVEIVRPLALAARERLAALGFKNAHVHLADGRLGWPDAAPYDGILLAAAPEELPAGLLDQLKPGRRLVAPIGPLREQILKVYEKDSEGAVHIRDIFDVRFVPLLEGDVPS